MVEIWRTCGRQKAGGLGLSVPPLACVFLIVFNCFFLVYIYIYHHVIVLAVLSLKCFSSAGFLAGDGAQLVCHM